jgi:hypothetical protein
VRLDDLVVIGPGSEWFWAMPQFVAVVVTLVAIYRQLKAQGSANTLSGSRRCPLDGTLAAWCSRGFTRRSSLDTEADLHQRVRR